MNRFTELDYIFFVGESLADVKKQIFDKFRARIICIPFIFASLIIFSFAGTHPHSENQEATLFKSLKLLL